ncbi:MAG TPA: acyltransferase, partial [Mycobacterium sp.]
WPVIVLLGTMMATSAYYYATVLALAFGLALAVYHLVENPLRYAGRQRAREIREEIKHGLYTPERATKVAVVTALALLALSLITYAMRPDAYQPGAHRPPASVCCGQPE